MNFKIVALTLLTIGVCLSNAKVFAQEGVELRIYTLDCGTIKVQDASILDATDRMRGPIELKNSCYVIQHGKEYMLWDAGFNPEAIKGSVKTDPFQPSITETIPESLKKIGLNIFDITKIGISHNHFDHIGQANTFKHAKLYIGTRDYNFMFEKKPVPKGLNPELLDAWADGKNVEKITTRKDVFGDGSVMIIPASGHTHGHLALQVNLKVSGPYLLTSDTWYTYQNYKYNLVSDFEANPEQSKRTMRYMKAYMRQKKAKIVIGHDPNEIVIDHASNNFEKMPDLPAYLY